MNREASPPVGAAHQGSDVAAELALRLADVHELLSKVEYDEDGFPVNANDPGLFSALDYALRGSPGCIEPEEWQDAREAALAKHADYLDIPAGEAGQHG